MKLKLAALLLLLLTAAATACTGTGAVETEERQVLLKDSRVVTCVNTDGYNSGGISCNWLELDAPR